MSSEDILSQPPPPVDARIGYGNDLLQFFDLRVPKTIGLTSSQHDATAKVIPREREQRQARVEGSAFPLIIFIHGGFWRAKYDLVHAGHLCAALTKAGVATLNVEYRRVGNPGGGWPASLQDIEAALDLTGARAEQHRLDINQAIVVGHSAGGQLALALAARRISLRGVIALAPISDLRRACDLHLSNDAVVEFLGGTPVELPATYAEASPIELPISIPQVIIHGSHDDTVPIEMSRSYVETKTKRGEDARMLELDCGHFELINPASNAWPYVLQAVLDLLKP